MRAQITQLGLMAILVVSAALYPIRGIEKPRMKFEGIFSWPNCRHVNHSSSWCTRADEEEIAGRYPVVERIFANLTEHPINNLFLATTIFSSCDAAEIICKQLAPQASTFVLVDTNHPMPECLDSLISKCSTAAGRPAELLKLGARKPWNVQHVKTLLIENNNSPEVTMVLGSGNFTDLSFTLSFNNWIKVTADRGTSLVKQQVCLTRALKAAASISNASVEYAKSAFDVELMACRIELEPLEFEDALRKEGIAPLFTPLRADKVRQRIFEAIDGVPDGGEISAVSQLLTSKRHIAALSRAASRGVHVRLILDDDNVTGENEEGVPDLMKILLKTPGIETRFIETNKSEYQLMHMKFLILNRQKMILGSGQLSNAAYSVNFENTYFITEESLITEHAEAFERLWNLARSAQEITDNRTLRAG